MKYYFNEDIAKQLGVEEAIMFSNIAYWIKYNEANEKNFYEGNYRTFNSMEAFSKLFPFWSKKQILRMLANLKDKGLILTGNFNKLSYDRTLWYAIGPNGKMEMPKWENGNAQTVTPIPNEKPDNKLISSSFKKEEARKEVGEVDIKKEDINITLPVDIKKENKNKEIAEDIQKIFVYWNAQKQTDKFWIGVRKVDDNLTKILTKILKTYSKEEIELGLSNYKKDIKLRKSGTSYSEHRFTIQKFFTQSNGFVEYYNKNF